MSKYLAYYVNGVRELLQDENSDDYRWEDYELESHILDAVEEVSRYVPQEKRTALGLTEDEREIDISSLTNRIRVVAVEYKPLQWPPEYPEFSIWGDILTLKVSSDPDATSEGTLTGTITFTKDSTAVSGSGTAFDTELEVDDFIRKSDGTEWYKVASIASATALTLASASSDNGADTASSTLYGADPAYIYWTRPHELTTESSTLIWPLEALVVQGGAANALMAWAREKREGVSEGGGNVAADMMAMGQWLWLIIISRLERMVKRPIERVRFKTT